MWQLCYKLRKRELSIVELADYQAQVYRTIANQKQKVLTEAREINLWVDEVVGYAKRLGWFGNAEIATPTLWWQGL